MADLRAEVRAESRMVKEALDQFRGVFETLQTSHAAVLRELEPTPAAQTGVLRFAENAATGARHVGADLHGAASVYSDAMQTIAPNPRPAASLFGVAISAMTEIHSVWVEWMGQTTRAGTQMSQDLLQAAKDQQRFVANGVQGWMEHNASIMQITMHITQAGLRP